CPERLDKLFITAVSHTPERASMTLRKSAKDPSEGIEIVMRTDTSSDAYAMRIGKDGSSKGLPETLSAADAAAAGRLWARITGTVGELVIHRRHLTAASLGGVAVGEIVHPSAIAEALIDAISPIVRQIATRTATPRELALKRFLGDGRREELFISYDTI